MNPDQLVLYRRYLSADMSLSAFLPQLRRVSTLFQILLNSYGRLTNTDRVRFLLFAVPFGLVLATICFTYFIQRLLFPTLNFFLRILGKRTLRILALF